MTSKVCSKCRAVKPESEFSKNRVKKDGLQAYCKPCHREANQYRNRTEWNRQWQKKRREVNKEKFFEWLSLHPCIDCGETDIVVLELDHIKPKGGKKHTVSLMISSNLKWETVFTEIQKCVVRCANCHRRKTAGDFNYRKVGWKSKRT